MPNPLLFIFYLHASYCSIAKRDWEQLLKLSCMGKVQAIAQVQKYCTNIAKIVCEFSIYDDLCWCLGSKQSSTSFKGREYVTFYNNVAI